jgi:hypothetical protein
LQYIRFNESSTSGNLLSFGGTANFNIVMPDRASNVAGMATADVKVGNVSLGIIANTLVAGTVIEWTHTNSGSDSIVGYSTLTLTSNAYIYRPSQFYAYLRANVTGFSRENLRTANGTGYGTYLGNGYGNVYLQTDLNTRFVFANNTVGIYGGYS